jgi:predicted MPP superfamily phosphohydrolase
MSLSAALDNVVASLAYHKPVWALFHCALGATGVWLLRRRPPLDAKSSVLRALAWTVAALGYAALAALVTGNPFFAINMVAHAVFIHAPVIALYLAVRLSARAAKAAWALVAVVLVAIAVDAFVIEPTSLTVRRLTVQSAKLTRPLRAVVLADLQFDRFDEHTRSALRLAMAERPDVLLLPGDYAQLPNARGAAALRREANAFLRSIRFGAPLGIFVVEGNVEWEPGWEALFEGLDAQLFTAQRRVETGELVVTGMGLRESGSPSLTIASEPRFHIAIGHAPDFALGDVRADLLVAGHTHGGQVQLPIVGPLMTLSAVPREWAAGNREVRLSDGRTLVVSRGVGLERGAAPRLRFRCKPEVVVIELRPAR